MSQSCDENTSLLAAAPVGDDEQCISCGGAGCGVCRPKVAADAFEDSGASHGEEPKRALCFNCNKSLSRSSDMNCVGRCFTCASAKECSRSHLESFPECYGEILPGELHFCCEVCGEGWEVCQACGPGVVIERKFDYYDPQKGTLVQEDIPDKVLHKRKSKKRGLVASVQDEADPELVASVKAGADLAHGIVERTRALIERVGNDAMEMRDQDWHEESLLGDLLGGGDIAASLVQLAGSAQKVLSSQTTVSEATVPCKVYGDLHGQLRDLLLLLHMFGAPDDTSPSFVFNGDFVDRGKHQLEVVTILLAFKVAMPDKVWLNRGNHEDPTMSKKYGFYDACMAVGDGGSDVFAALHSAFEWLPLGTVIGDRILAVHGGIGDGEWLLDDL